MLLCFDLRGRAWQTSNRRLSTRASKVDAQARMDRLNVGFESRTNRNGAAVGKGTRRHPRGSEVD
jgi:hypothetical protein